MKPGRFDWSTSRLLVVCLLFIFGHRTLVRASLFSQTVTDSQFMTRSHSPYHIREMIEIEKTGSLNIESGVIINFHPGAGILVRGALIAKGNAEARIVMTAAETGPERSSPDVRLIDGPTPLSGRLQIRHLGEWRSVCTNSRNWTVEDYQTTCRQMGLTGGRYVQWMDRVNSSSSRPLLLENPRCYAGSSSLFQCDWESRKVGAGVCDYHPDLGMECSGYYSPQSGLLGTRWRGIRFEQARHKKDLIQGNTLYVKVSESFLHYVDIIKAGVDRNGQVVSALESVGVAPQMDKIRVEGSAYNGINMTSPDSPIALRGATVTGNAGYGVYVNTSSGLVLLDACTVSDNGQEGVKYVFHDTRPGDQTGDAVVGTHDLCTSASTSNPVYPLPILAESYYESIANARCEKRFTTTNGQVLTLHFVYLMADRADSNAEVVVHDGPDARSPLIAKFTINNGTRPQSVTTTRNAIWILYTARASSRTVLQMELTSGFSKSYDLNVTNSLVTSNGARGILAENIRSLLHVQASTLRQNHMAGVQVLDGAGDVNVTASQVADNFGDGVNMTYSGGRVNVSYSVIENNQGHGVVVWFNQTSLKLALNQELIVAYNKLSANQWTSVLVGNFCTAGSVNISGNIFNMSQWNALEILSCWKPSVPNRLVNVGHNQFFHNQRVGVVLSPAVSITAVVQHNLFRFQRLGCLLIRNPDALELESLSSDVLVADNRFENNTGLFVANLGLSQYAGDVQKLFFTRNWIKRNTIRQPFSAVGLNPRSRVAAVIVVGSSNVNITRNMIENPESSYEIGSQLEDQQLEIAAVRNWLGAKAERGIYYRLFDRKDRYNLARVAFKPFLLHDTNFETDSVSNVQDFVPTFITPGSREIGGEVTGQEELIDPGVYHVTRDIVIHPTGRLTVAFGVTLRFDHSLGMMVGGELLAEGSSSPDGTITFSLMDRMERENSTAEIAVRLVGGSTNSEGRLQVKIDGRWGTVCNEGWTKQSAAVACHQMGLVLNPRDWLLEPNQLQSSMGVEDPVLMSHVDCTVLDTDVRSCFHRPTRNQTENYCGHEMDVGLKCHQVSWAGLRFGMTAKKSILRSATVERAGLFDYATHSFQPAVRIDFHHHVLDRLRLVGNDHDGLGIMYSDIYYPERIPSLKNSHISQNRGHGVSLRSLGLQMAECHIEDNTESGIHYNPMISRQELREMVGWLAIFKADKFIFVPETQGSLELFADQPRYLRTTRLPKGRQVESTLIIQTDQRNVIGMQVINPIQNSSTETILLLDYGDLSNEVWNVRLNLTSFPTVSSSYKLTVQYQSGLDAKGGMLILLTAYRRTDLQIQRSRLLTGPIPILSVSSTNIRRNGRGMSSLHYNLFLSPGGNSHYLRKANETIQLIGCEISQSKQEAVLVHTPYRDVGRQPLAEIKYIMNYTTIADNQRAVVQNGRDLRDSNNLFHWILQNDTIRNNRAGGFDVRLPYVLQYNENYTHSVYVADSLWTANRQFGIVVGGHFARLNVTDNIIEDNEGQPGIMSLRGMEKEMYILRNTIRRNTGNFMVEFDADSQSEILGEVQAYFTRNVVKDNGHATRSMLTNPHLAASYAVAMKGVQKVNVTDNLIGSNTAMDYELLAGIKSSRLDNFVNVQRNYWGTSELEQIRERIFDFDDWNSYAIARFRPYLLETIWDGGQSSLTDIVPPMDFDHLGGRLFHDLVLVRRDRPYIVHTDLTVMPGVTLTVLPGVEMEFFPSVGILVLGVLHADGHWEAPIRMRPATPNEALTVNYRSVRQLAGQQENNNNDVRLCLEGECKSDARQGYLELFNKTTQQWVPVCDRRFTEQNARVVCRQLGMDTFHEYKSFGRRWEFQLTTLNRVRHWPEPIQCTGTESKLDECDIRMNGQVYDHVYSCPWDSEDFVFVDCGNQTSGTRPNYWGGIRFSVSSFEDNLVELRSGLPVHLDPHLERHSRLHYVHITGAGILHGEKSPAVLSVHRSPIIQQVNITHCASDGISLVSPALNLPLLDNRIEYNGGIGLSVLMLNGETRDADLSAFSPLRLARGLPYNTFGILDACDPGKQVLVEERILVYYRYDNRPADCVKIFTTRYGVKTFGFRLLQLNLVNSTNQPWQPDSLTLYDGDIYNITSTLIATVISTTSGPAIENRLYRTKKPSLSLKIHSSGDDGSYGFIAEVITLPIAAIGFGRDIRHNISYSGFLHNRAGAVQYSSAGEINPILTMEWNQIVNNGVQLYGNFSTAEAAVALDVQNMDSLLFRNNLIRKNQGGLKIQSDSNGVPTSLKAVIHNNVFADNNATETIYLQGRRASPYQEVTLYHNYVTRSNVRYKNVMLLDQVVANLTENHIFNNLGYHIMEVYGFGRVRLPIYQTFYHNSYHKNFAMDRDSRGTIIAGSSGQRYIDNVFVNPDNDYEMIALNWTGNATWEASLEMQRTAIEAGNNWWGYNESTAVVGRIRDFRDLAELLQVRFEPFYRDNRTVLSGKCDPGWTQVGDTCYVYIGVPMNFTDAKDFCKKDNASLPYLMNNYYGVMEFLQSQQVGFDYFARAWVQHLDMIGQCVVFVNRRVERSPCDLLLPFLCEADPHVILDPLGWTDDALTVALLGASAAALLLVILCVAFWVSKSKHRAEQRFERRNSIRASIRSSRSFNSLASSSGFLDSAGARRKPPVAHSGRNGGSVDSIAKSQYESSVEDNRSFDIYETEEHHPANTVGLPHPPQQGFSYSQLEHHRVNRPAAQTAAVNHHPGGQLTFENQGFRDTSTYAESRAASDYWGDSSSIDAQSNVTTSVSVHHNGAVSYHPGHLGHQQPGRSLHEPDYSRVRSRSEAGVLDNYSTASVITDSTLAMKRELDDSDAASAITLPQSRRVDDASNKRAPLINRPPIATRSQQLLETNFDAAIVEAPRHAATMGFLAASNENFFLPHRSKSTPLETDM